MLKYLGDPTFKYWEWQYLRSIHKYLTKHWQLLQCGTGPMAVAMWRDCLMTLELDRKAQRDLFLLIHSGIVGRTKANRILWDLLTGPALEPPYQDLSSLVTHLVYGARKSFDRPPREHEDLRWWTWGHLSNLNDGDVPWSPRSGPERMLTALCVGPGGLPLPPPRCYQVERGTYL